MKTSAELKAMAKQRMAPKITSLVGAVFIFGALLFGLCIAIAFVYTSNLIATGVFASEAALTNYLTEMMEKEATIKDLALSYGVDLFLGALLSTISVGFSYVCLKAARNEEFKASDIFAVYNMNPDRIIIIFFVSYLAKAVLTLPVTMFSYAFPSKEAFSIQMFISFVLEIVSYAGQVVITVMLSQAFFIYIDDPYQNSFITMSKSVGIMKYNFGKYIYLVLSFIPWYFVILITFGVASIWVLPYINVTYALFYMNIRGELGVRIDTVV